MRSDLNQMAIFANVVKAGSFTSAARALGMPKSTVSKRVGELEDRLGLRLLHRTTRHVKLTEAGAAYYEHCKRIVEEAEEADRSVTDQDESPRGTVRVTAPLLLGETLAPAMERFLIENPNVSIQFWVTDRRIDLIEERIDIAIRPGALPDSTLVARRLGDIEHVICASPSYLRGRDVVKEPNDLRAHWCIGFQEGRIEALWSFERNGERRSVAVHGRYGVSSLRLVRTGALAGLGVANVPEFLVRDDIAAGGLVRLLSRWTVGRGAVHLVYPTNRNLSPGVRALVDFLMTAFAENRPWATVSWSRRGRRSL
jgi:DNA-binding transcriptional LysR family regulator